MVVAILIAALADTMSQICIARDLARGLPQTNVQPGFIPWYCSQNTQAVPNTDFAWHLTLPPPYPSASERCLIFMQAPSLQWPRTRTFKLVSSRFPRQWLEEFIRQAWLFLREQTPHCMSVSSYLPVCLQWSVPSIQIPSTFSFGAWRQHLSFLALQAPELLSQVVLLLPQVLVHFFSSQTS